MSRAYSVISADSHLDLNPEQWKHRVPTTWRDQAPKVVRLETGEDAVIIADRKPAKLGFTTRVNVPRDSIHLQVPTFESGGGTGLPEKRLREQDEDGVEAEVLFSRIQWTLRAIKDDEAYLAMVHAYNQYLAEEYCAAAPDRLIAMGVIPGTGIDTAMAELEYCANAGLRGVVMDKFPNGKGFPTPEDDRFWAAALDLNMAITHHTNGGTTRMTGPNEPTFPYARGVGAGGEGEGFGGDPMRHWLFRFCGDAACAPLQLAFAGVWDRFPRLQIYWAETMAGWLQYALWQTDEHYDRYKAMAKGLYGLEPLERLPSHYLREHCLWGFLYDPVGVRNREAVGSDKLMWGSDFPHAASDWPNSRRVIEENFAGVPADERKLMLVENAVRFFHLNAD